MDVAATARPREHIHAGLAVFLHRVAVFFSGHRQIPLPRLARSAAHASSRARQGLPAPAPSSSPHFPGAAFSGRTLDGAARLTPLPLRKRHRAPKTDKLSTNSLDSLGENIYDRNMTLCSASQNEETLRRIDLTFLHKNSRGRRRKQESSQTGLLAVSNHRIHN